MKTPTSWSIMFAVAIRTVQRRSFVAAERDVSTLRRVAVQIVHRHGDRTPITPLRDEDYWSKQLVTKATLENIAANTELIHAASANTHAAGGRGPFGKLTKLGLLQLVELGSRLRDQLEGTNEPVEDDDGRMFYPHIFTKDHPLEPNKLRVISTNFARTIQSVQGLLVGLFPDGTSEKIPIDVRHTDWIIPDPQPRRTPEQAMLEESLTTRPHILAKERELLPLAMRSTQALHHLLASDAREADFGVAQEHPSEVTIEVQPLSWNQLAEVTKCLAVRDRLPEGITEADEARISEHTAWRWFEAFRNQRLAHLSMGTLTGTMVDYLSEAQNSSPLTIWSAHDSTLICLMCAFRLEQPAVWPGYGSYLMLELLLDNNNDQYVRFSLNGQTLRSQWGEKAVELIPLKQLAELLRGQEQVVATSSQ